MMGEAFDQNFFDLFGLPVGYQLDGGALDRAYHDLQTQVHPDRFAHLSDAEKRVSMQWATRANEAYRTLREPLARARYMLQLRGHSVDAENNTAMPADFLMQQMEWREAVGEAREAADVTELEALRHRVTHEMQGEHASLPGLLDEHNDVDGAARTIRRLMFQEKLLLEIDDALEGLYDAL